MFLEKKCHAGWPFNRKTRNTPLLGERVEMACFEG